MTAILTPLEWSQAWCDAIDFNLGEDEANAAAKACDRLRAHDMALRAENAALKDQLAHIGCAGMSAMPKKIGGGP